ncbi:RimJ/RimL family protein N-acetyltransferase [Mucilaginibacter frigoritolerans]|uniref:RimJ/RimL family protein N-acetyltransferase n=1 Tax=Mucilaginibacter frigoritolerans TaxID=652788 RepID=A0A562TRP9_9SPHI|nr:GNAT family protein [Mucilaginibacter frigoritolerans]TWI96271.1 RimJ/RimL family protein N-acetyltransferase [Mucilaginibacter frigoritolerans]
MTLNFDRNVDYVLEDDRVLLTPLKETDIEFLLPFALNEPETWKYSHQSAKGEQGLRTYINEALKNRATGDEYPFIVFDKQTSSYAGSTRFYDIKMHWQTVQLGYTWYGEKFRGTGLNKHCKFLLLQFAFEKMNALRVEFRADARNELSIAAMKSIGCKSEGILRSNMPLHGGGRRDSIVLSILKNEWENDVKESLGRILK